MRRTFLYGLMTALLVAGATTAPRAQAGKQTLVAVLSGGSEAPNVVNTGAYGKATIIIDFAPGIVGVSGPFQLSGSTKNFIARPAAGIRSMEEAMIAIAGGNTYV